MKNDFDIREKIEKSVDAKAGDGKQTWQEIQKRIEADTAGNAGAVNAAKAKRLQFKTTEKRYRRPRNRFVAVAASIFLCAVLVITGVMTEYKGTASPEDSHGASLWGGTNGGGMSHEDGVLAGPSSSGSSHGGTKPPVNSGISDGSFGSNPEDPFVDAPSATGAPGADMPEAMPPDPAVGAPAGPGSLGTSGGQTNGYGILTAGEWNDNQHWDFWQNLWDSQHSDFISYLRTRRLRPAGRFAIKVNDSTGAPFPGITAKLLDANGESLYTAITDNRGNAYLFLGMSANQNRAAEIAFYDGEKLLGTVSDIRADEAEAYTFTAERAYREPAKKELDLMFVIDTTGSMGDELSYLANELENVVASVVRQFGGSTGVDILCSANFYRDLGDDYVVKSAPFEDAGDFIRRLRAERAAGGGDTPEAVELALEDAIENHVWREDSVKLLFLVLDAPTHEEQSIDLKMQNLYKEAASMGIRIIPIVASGNEKDTEILMRGAAIATGGTYIFITGDSGIGDFHMEPTVGEYEVEKLNELLIKVIGRYLETVSLQ